MYDEEFGEKQGGNKKHHSSSKRNAEPWDVQRLCWCFPDPYAKSRGELPQLLCWSHMSSNRMYVCMYVCIICLLCILYQESKIKDSLYHIDNLHYCVMNLFAAGTDTTGNTLQWYLLLMAKYPHFQGAKKQIHLLLSESTAHCKPKVASHIYQI